MVFFNVKVFASSGTTFKKAKLYLASGIIEFERDSYGNINFSHISSEVREGRMVSQIEEEAKPEPKPEEPKTQAASVEQSKPEKKQKKKDNK